jgi:hypothetical protein
MNTVMTSPDPCTAPSGKGRPSLLLWLTLALASVLNLQACGGDETASAQAEAEADTVSPWDDYNIEPPSDEIQTLLVDTPYLYPERICDPVPDGIELPPGTEVEVDSSGQELVCVWRSVVGNVPEGFAYTDLAECDMPLTQAPSWFVAPEQKYVSDLALLDDPAFVEELDWVQSQVESSGCACCHSSTVSEHTSGFDVGAPAVWTDTIENYQLAMISGRLDDHILFGALPEDVNHGFTREHTMFPTTDPERMKAFFNAEFDRRNGTPEQVVEAQAAFDTFFDRLLEPYNECVTPWQGLSDGRVVWDGDDEIRQFYVLKTDAATPGFPPNRDRPEGTVWAIYVSPDQAPIPSGTIELGQIPEGAYQAFPEDGSPPELVAGETYRLFATPDFQLIRSISCTITY